jgi:Tol biopolymer transport system component
MRWRDLRRSSNVHDRRGMRAGPESTDEHGAIWSPDGSQIAFASARESENSDVWVMGADGSTRVA